MDGFDVKDCQGTADLGGCTGAPRDCCDTETHNAWDGQMYRGPCDMYSGVHFDAHGNFAATKLDTCETRCQLG